jgi:uncharacterized protein YrzB (UPF0473 family)
MADQYGSDFISIVDDDGTEYELEVLSTIEYNGASYIAAIPASEELNPEVILLKSVEEDGETILCVIEDEQELEAVNELVMESLFQESDME